MVRTPRTSMYNQRHPTHSEVDAAWARGVALASRDQRLGPHRSVLTSPDQGILSRVTVLGAGMAGLMVARQLTYFGVKVTLLESRDRVGGRIWSQRKGEAFGELGAMIVTGLSANPVSVLARQIPLTLVPINTECSLHDSRGRLIPREMDNKIEEEFNRLLGTAAYLCHAKSMDSITLENGSEKPLSLGEVIELLIRYQDKHRVQLKVTHRKLIVKLLERKNELLNQMAIERQNIEDAYERWQTASARANPCSVVTPRVESLQMAQFGVGGELSLAVQRAPVASDIKPDVTELERHNESRSTDHGATGRNESRHSMQSTKPASLPVYNVSAQFEVRRLLSELHEAWKKFDPLQDALNRVNRQLEILLQYPPQDVYLTEAERRTLDWHLANLEFANATELRNLSLRHWDQDDVFELNGDHCVVKEGYGAVTDALAACITNGLHVPSATNVLGTPNMKHRDYVTSYQFGSGHIEFKSSVKRIILSSKGVRVEALNAAFSQDDLIEHEAHVVVCTLPLGILKESVKHPHQVRPESAKSTPSKLASGPQSVSGMDYTVAALTRLTSPVFQPALPDWKVEAIKRLGFGVLNKVVLFFERCFWDRSQNVFGHVSESTDKRGELYMFWSVSDRPVLTALVAGRAAVELEQQQHISQSQSVSPQRDSPGSRAFPTASTAQKTSIHSCMMSGLSGSTTTSSATTGTASLSALQEPIVARAMQILRAIFGQDPVVNGISSASISERKRIVPNPIDAIVTRWRSDPHSRGSYSYVGVTASGADYDQLSEPVTLPSSESDSSVNVKTSVERSSPTKQSTSSAEDAPSNAPATSIPRLFFAGEHTCRCYPATVHGALLSGLREAARIANTFFPGSTPVYDPGFKLNTNITRVV
ncbi:Lysine-specific histone demethylase 1A [Fasciola gigantica]|uniref:Lysine-specific histone demethylase 1A n=1 Tax=Fasciola gigantica TaxID=46835 RepID=A0A504Y7K5_FASGI|nr:Lysine-specific histone demethylase 1A [Fasciola gigantica]